MNRNLKKGIIILLLWHWIILTPAYAEKKETGTAGRSVGNKESGKKPGKKSGPAKYVYQGYKNRNPFYRAGSAAAASEAVFGTQKTQGTKIDISNFRLTGIMTDISGMKYAILSDLARGSYILKNGWLYDIEGERVPSITGTVFEERVIVILGTRIKELKLPEVKSMIRLE